MGEGVENGGGGQDGRRVEVMNNNEDNIVARGRVMGREGYVVVVGDTVSSKMSMITRL